MNLKALSAMLVILALFALPLRQAKAQNPITDLAATGVNTFGSGAIQLINTAINTLANAGGLLATVISVGLSILNSLITFLMGLITSAGIGIFSGGLVSCVGFCVSGIGSLIMSAVSGILSGVISMISSVFCGELFSVLNSVNGLLTAACCVPNTLLYIAWWVIFVVLNLWLGVGFVVEFIFAIAQAIGGFILGLLALIGGVIPIVSIIYGILGTIVWIIWAAIWALLDVAAYGVPSILLVVAAGLFSAIGTSYMPEMSKNYLAVMGAYLANLNFWGASIAMIFTVMFGGLLLPAASSWIGGMQGGAQWVLSWASALVIMFKIIVTGIVWLMVAIVSAIITLLAIPSALADMIKNVCGV